MKILDEEITSKDCGQQQAERRHGEIQQPRLDANGDGGQAAAQLAFAPHAEDANGTDEECSDEPRQNQHGANKRPGNGESEKTGGDREKCGEHKKQPENGKPLAVVHTDKVIPPR